MSTLVAEADLDNCPPGLGMLAVLNYTGDTRHFWDPDNEVEVRAARQVFNQLKGEGYQAFAVAEGGGTGTLIRGEFPEEAGKIIMTTPLQGG